MSKKEHAIIILLLLVLLIVFVGCGTTKDIKFNTAYPNKIMYIVGVDKKIDLSGMEISYYRFDTGGGVIRLGEEDELIVEQEIDFNTSGVYPVTVYKRDLPKFTFAIQVVSEEYLREKIK